MRLRQTLALVAVLAVTLAAAPAAPPDDADVAGVPSADLHAEGHPAQRYFLIGAGEGVEAPEGGFSLLVVLPGGDGGPGFLPFLKRVHKNALGNGYLLAQPVAYKWTEEQQVVWPTDKNRVEGQMFTTEEFVAAVVRDASQKHPINPERVFLLGWSSGGPPAYAAALAEGSPVKGAFAAMSVFKATQLPPLSAAKGRPFYIYHSPQDEICPIGMAKGARFMLEQSGAKVQLVEYEGGHGWHGDVYGSLRQGLAFLEGAASAAAPAVAGAVPAPAVRAAAPAGPEPNLLFRDGLENGTDKPKDWSPGTRVNGVDYVWDTESSHEGTRSLCLRKTAQSFFPIASWTRTAIPNRGRNTLQISVWIKAQQAAKAVVDVGFTNQESKFIGHAWAIYVGARNPGESPATHDWVLYTGQVEVPATARALSISLQMHGPGTVWFDDITAAYVR